MDLQPQTVKPISDDQELAKALAGITQDVDNLGTEKSQTETNIIPVTEPETTSEGSSVVTPEVTPEVESTEALPNTTPTSVVSDSLDSIKKDALVELRPLVDKLNLSPEDKFDIYLLLLRSTDDTTLIAPAHETARSITDESKRAQALLDIIKEIDFLSNPTA